ncbi:hypothetical protein K3G63_17190 [Hymenobacter sp. HSC-4F20]|uniref:hypothetical protein n=1 Tax=Hymenobacter sp. HSC-4F20 TaxID=2864135 RepID=UPI001C7343BE|nr:hypothetical protein [Hymenobacter sp. HSC-4F20]MBX0292187.1 hypothetical protein [Hymenobacter sp. HSC-4F20]
MLYLKTMWRQVMLAVALLVLYALPLQAVPVSGFGAANLEPATKLGAWPDRQLFSRHHLNHDQEGWDPELVPGLISNREYQYSRVLAG